MRYNNVSYHIPQGQNNPCQHKVLNKGNNKITKSEQSYKGKVKTHNYINRQNQSTTGKLKNRNLRHTLTKKFLTFFTFLSLYIFTI